MAQVGGEDGELAATPCLERHLRGDASQPEACRERLLATRGLRLGWGSVWGDALVLE